MMRPPTSNHIIADYAGIANSMKITKDKILERTKGKNYDISHMIYKSTGSYLYFKELADALANPVDILSHEIKSGNSYQLWKEKKSCDMLLYTRQKTNVVKILYHILENSSTLIYMRNFSNIKIKVENKEVI